MCSFIVLFRLQVLLALAASSALEPQQFGISQFVDVVAALGAGERTKVWNFALLEVGPEQPGGVQFGVFQAIVGLDGMESVVAVFPGRLGIFPRGLVPLRSRARPWLFSRDR